MSARAALAFLLLRSLRNRALRQFRRVKSPRYAIALIAGLAYIVVLFGNPRDRGGIGRLPESTAELLVAGGVLLVVIWSWLYAHDRRALTFSTAEVTFLFPAPITRRSLIHFKLFRAQLLILFNTLIWTLLLGAGRPELPVWMRALAVWCALSTLQLHRLGATLVRTSLGEHGWHGLRRSPLAVVAVATAAVLIVGAVIQAAPLVAAIGGFGDIGATVQQISELRLPRIVVAPFRALMAPLFAASPGAWLGTIGPALVILLLHYLWVLRSDAAFEEAAADASFARSRELAGRRTGGAARSGGYSPPLVSLSPRGRPEVALVWKNVAMVLRRRRARLLGFAFFVALICAAAAQEAAPRLAQTVGTLMLMWAGLLIMIGPQWARNDLRSDLASLDLLRSYPLPGSAVVQAESAASALIVTLAQMAMIAVAVVALQGDPEWSLSTPLHAALLIGSVVVLPFVNYIGLMLFNGAALLYPAWITPGSTRGGIDTLGQNLVTAVAYTIALALVLLVPLTAGALAWRAFAALAGSWAPIAGGVATAAGLALEAWLLSLWLGGVFERIDPPTSGLEPAG